MSEIIPATVRIRDGVGSSTIQCPMLTATNYNVWAVRMKLALKVHKVWEAIEEETASTEKNDLALALLCQSIPESLVLQVSELKQAKQVWESIKTRYAGAERVKEARLQTLMSEFDRLKMKETESIDEFGGKLAEIASKSAALGVIIEEPRIVKKLLKSVPRKKYIHIVATFEQVLDLNTTGFEDILGRLKAYEERIAEEEETEQDQGKLMYTNTEGQANQSHGGNRSSSDQNNQDYNNRGYYRDHNNESYRGRGRGGRSYYRGRGRGRFSERDASRVTCFRCDKVGHFAAMCPDRLLKLQETNEVDNT